MKVYKKFLIVFAVVNILMGMIYLNQFGAKAAGDFINTMESDASSFINQGANAVKGSSGFKIGDITEDFVGIGQVLTMVGAGVMVAVVSYMGIKYIISPPDKQAALKQQLTGVVVAGIVIFGAYGIWSAILKVVSNF